MSDSERISELFASLEDGAATLFDADGLAVQIADQNDRYKESGNVFSTEPEILELVQLGITEEQEETFANILAIAPESSRLYKNIGRVSITIENGIASADAHSSELQTVVKEQEAMLEEKRESKKAKAQMESEELIANAERLAPRSVEAVKKLLQSRGAVPISDQEISDLEDHILELMDQEDEAKHELEKIQTLARSVDATIGKIAVAWELPLALIDRNRSLFAVLDELPVEPILTERESQKARQFSERHVDQPEAAQYAALFLSEHSGQTVTVDQIAHILYSPEVIAKLTDHNLRSRVTTILGPQVGECLKAILGEEGYVLQYGWRRTMEKKESGHTSIVRRERIYRAIHIDQINEYAEQNYFEGEGFEDSFEPLRIYNDSEAKAKETTTPALNDKAMKPIGDNIEDENTETTVNASYRGVSPEVNEDGHETNAERKERLKNELLAAITGPARLLIKSIGEHGALEQGGIKYGHLKNVFTTDIDDETFRDIVGSRVTPNDEYWVRTIDAVKLMLTVTTEDKATRASVSGRQWRRPVGEKIDELVQREIRGMKRRKELLTQ